MGARRDGGMVDAADSKSAEGNLVGVRLPLPALDPDQGLQPPRRRGGESPPDCRRLRPGHLGRAPLDATPPGHLTCLSARRIVGGGRWIVGDYAKIKREIKRWTLRDLEARRTETEERAREVETRWGVAGSHSLEAARGAPGGPVRRPRHPHPVRGVRLPVGRGGRSGAGHHREGAPGPPGRRGKATTRRRRQHGGDRRSQAPRPGVAGRGPARPRLPLQRPLGLPRLLAFEQPEDAEPPDPGARLSQAGILRFLRRLLLTPRRPPERPSSSASFCFSARRRGSQRAMALPLR